MYCCTHCEHILLDGLLIEYNKIDQLELPIIVSSTTIVNNDSDWSCNQVYRSYLEK